MLKLSDEFAGAVPADERVGIIQPLCGSLPVSGVVPGKEMAFASPLQSIPFNSYLQSEWRQRKQGEVHFYQRLSSFLGEYFQDIKLSSELEKDMVIDELASSRSFMETHRAIAALKAAGDFTAPQLNAIVSAYVNNDQVFRIIGTIQLACGRREYSRGWWQHPCSNAKWQSWMWTVGDAES